MNRGDYAHVPAVVASRCCRFPLLSLPAVLLLFSLIALMPPSASAQALPPGWSASPCDVNGKSVSANLDFYGFYPMSTTVTGKASNTYPPAMIYAAVQDPYHYGRYLADSQPLTLSTITSLNYGGNAVRAYNYCSQDGTPAPWIYVVPTAFGVSNPPYASGFINGTVTEDITQQSVFFFHVQWYGPLPAPALPPGVSVLLKTQLSASAAANYWGTVRLSGLSAVATATDGSPFNETASAFAGDAAAGATSTPSVVGYHLVTAAVDKQTGIATVFLNGQTHVQAVNVVACGTGGPVNASANSSVSGGVRLDSRAVTIGADCDPTSYKLLIVGVDANGDGLWAKTAHNPTEMKGDIGIPYGEQHTAVGVDAQGHATSTFFQTPSNRQVIYTGHIPGNWATQDSHFWWKSSLKNYSNDGVLYRLTGIGVPTESEIPVLKNTYVGPIVDSDNRGTIISNEAGATGTTDTISFTFRNGNNKNTSYPNITDGDTATATAAYSLKIHQPLEWFPSHRPDETNHYKIASPVGGDIPMSFQGLDYSTYRGTGQNGISALCVLNSPAVGWGISNDVTNMLSSVPYPGWWGVLDVVFQGANIWVSHNTPVAQNFSADFNDVAWSDPQSDGDGYYKAKKGAKTDYHMSPRVRVQYRWRYTLVDVYNAAGFQSETLNHSEQYIGPQNVFGYFTYTGPPLKL